MLIMANQSTLYLHHQTQCHSGIRPSADQVQMDDHECSRHVLMRGREDARPNLGGATCALNFAGADLGKLTASSCSVQHYYHVIFAESAACTCCKRPCSIC